MTIQAPDPAGATDRAAQSWSEVWLKAVTQPTVASYEDMATRPGVSSKRAYIWVFAGSLIATAITLVWVLLSGSPSALGQQEGGRIAADLGTTIVVLICLAPLGGVFAILGLMITAGISQAIARALGGTGTFTQLAYLIAAYLAPLGILTSLLALVPLLNCLNLPVGVYSLFLNILAVKSVNRFSWGRAVLSSVVILAGILLVVAVVVIVILALLGPAIGNVFSNIIQEMGTPAP